MADSVLSVRQLNLYVRSLIEGDPRLINVAVTGEISNFKNHYSSGHWYFTLKDNDASIRCVMFRSSAQRVKFIPEDGVQVVLKGRVSIYEKDGQYQFYAEEMTAAGEGDLAAEFLRLKEKLQKEGYWVVGTDMHDAVDYRQVDYNMPTVLVVGSEGFGMGRLIKEKCDFLLSLPMAGKITSLNASVAAGIFMYEVVRQRNK